MRNRPLLSRLSNVDREKLRHRLVLAQFIAAPIGLIVLCGLLWRELPMHRIGENALGIGASVLIGVLGLEAFAVRLGLIVRLFGLSASKAAIWRIHTVTLFYYFFLPAGIGYDLVRAAKTGNATGHPKGTRLAGIVSVERLAGGLGLFVLLLLALPFSQIDDRSPLKWLDPSIGLWLGLISGFASLSAVFYILAQRRLPQLRLLYPAAAISAGAYAIMALGIWIAAEALDVGVGLTEILVALSGTLLFQLIPVNLFGVSFGEVAAVAVYIAYGLDRADAVFLVTIAYLQRLATALLGGLIEAVLSATWLVENKAGSRTSDTGAP